MMEYKEEEYLMLSGIQHYAFCKRQWALIHIEQQWQENVHTIEGELMHKNAHDRYLSEKRSGVIITRGMPIYSRTMGVSGNCDIVEFQKGEEGISLRGHRGFYKVYPVEYKKGSPKDTMIDILQLAAQAMCLEEMLSTEIAEGAIFYGETRHRERVVIDDSMRSKVKEYFAEMHQMYERRYTPKVKWTKSCNGCSLKNLCLPKLGKASNVKSYIEKAISEEQG